MTGRVNGERWARLQGLLDVEALRDRTVVVVGLGSGGSTVALELAKAGVPRFVLVDADRLEEANVIRHECDDRYLGWNKAEAVADLIAHRNPRAEVEVHPVDAFDLGERLEQRVARSSLVAACVDAEQPKHLLNRLCLGAAVPAVYAGVYERGVGGEVIRCSGGPEDACYACVTAVLKESAPVPMEEQLEYGMIGADGTLHGAPGLGLDVRFIALLQAKVCLRVLLEGDAAASDLPEIRGNVVLFGLAPVEGLFPRALAGATVTVPRSSDCLVCGIRSVGLRA